MSIVDTCIQTSFKVLKYAISIGKFQQFWAALAGDAENIYGFSSLWKYHLEACTYTSFQLFTNAILIGKFQSFQNAIYCSGDNIDYFLTCLNTHKF
jgi:hypothetical protein